MKRIALLVLLLWPLPAAYAQEKSRRPISIDDMFRFQRVADPQISPDGRLVAYVVGTVDMADNKVPSSIWLLPTEEGPARQLTRSGKNDRHPRWSPEGRSILFESNRSGATQLWLITVQGGEARQLTNLSTGAHNGTWSPDGTKIAFVSAVWPEFSHKPLKDSDALNKKRIDERAKSPVKARVFTRLFFRHWDEYVEDKRQHLFVLDLAAGEHGWQAKGEPRDVTPGDRDANPTSSTFSLGDDFTFSPDGKFLVFTAVPEQDEAWNTNYDLCRVPVSGGKIECLTGDNAAADGTPRFSPDGKLLAYRAQKRAGFEADRWQLYVVPTDPGGAFQNKPRSVTARFDSAIEDYVWAPDGAAILFAAEDADRIPIYQVSIEDSAVRKLVQGHTNASLSVSKIGNRLAFSRSSYTHPAEVRLASLPSGKLLSEKMSQNDSLLAELNLSCPQSVTLKGADDVPMQMWLLKPPGFDPTKKWPLVYLVHGGPQGAWLDAWSYRWNPQVWAAQGYVVALPNPRGSTGFGQKYVDDISGDWGGKCYHDLMAGVDYLEKQPDIDPDRMAAAGASFGGYMMNWFAVKTGKFKALITHCGVWNFDSMYATTEELWFDEWEHGGPPWGKRHSYEKHSPHRFAKNLEKFRTPMLVIHNDLDFRVPISEGIQLFTTLQRLGIPSRMVNFPDEGHWVLRPQNSRFWHQEVFGWLKKHVAR